MFPDSPTSQLQNRGRLILETDRLTLRLPTLADVKNIVGLGNDLRIAAHCRRLPHPFVHDHAVELVSGDRSVFVVEKTQELLGLIEVEWRERAIPDVHCWLGVAHWGVGYGTEAMRAAIDITFEESDIDQMTASARVANPTARNLLEKCGFQWNGVELHRFEALGSSTPVDCFRLGRSVWSSLKSWSSTTRRTV
jgi:RimJ/RimL family protein N-acetyltransferase